MQPWVGTATLVPMFVIGIVGAIATEVAQRKYPNTPYADHSQKASALFIMIAVFSAFWFLN